MRDNAIGAFELVVVNRYPFRETVARGAGRDEVIENIDIGGPSMVRSAAKNHAYVAIVTDPADYALVEGGSTTLDDRKRLAAKAYAATAARSEEHTAELQSLMRISYAVFCLKKKTKP